MGIQLDLPSSFRGAPPFQFIARSQLERSIGFLAHVPTIQAGHTATRLHRLYGGGGLYLTQQARIAEVRPTSESEVLRVRYFSGRPEPLWAAVEASLPEVRLGVTLRRFWVVEEVVPLTGAISYGVLDLRAMDVLERAGDFEEVRRRVHYANTSTAPYLREIQEARERDAVRSARGFCGLRPLPGC